MLGFKRFDTAAVTITGIELAEKIQKYHFKIGKLPGRPEAPPAIWGSCSRRLRSSKASNAKRIRPHVHKSLHQNPRKVAVTAVKKSQAMIAWAKPKLIGRRNDEAWQI